MARHRNPSVVHNTPLNEWLHSEGLLDERELATQHKNLPDIVQDRILGIRSAAKAEQTDRGVRSATVIPASPPEPLQHSCLTVEGPRPEIFSQVARHLPVVVHEIRGRRIFVGYHRTTVILGEQRYLQGVSSAASAWIAPLLARAPTALRIAGTLAVLYTDGAHMFSHWMFDLLPKLEVLRRAGWTESNIDFFVINPAPANFQMESLRKLGIPEHKLMMAEGLLVEADRLVIPSRIRIGFNTPPWVRGFIRDHFRPQQCSGSDRNLKLYISRALARGRRIENDDAIRGILEDRGYQTVYAEKHSVGEFAKLVARTQAIAAPHGAGLANVVFAPPGIQVLEMYGAHLTREFWLLTSGAGGQHFLLAGKDRNRRYPWQSTEFGSMPYNKRNIANYYVDPSDLERALVLMNESRRV